MSALHPHKTQGQAGQGSPPQASPQAQGRAEVNAPPSMLRQSLDDMLQTHPLVPQQAAQALRREGGAAGEALLRGLVRGGHMTEMDAAQILAGHYGLPVTDLADATADTDALGAVPYLYMKDHGAALCRDGGGRVLAVAGADGLLVAADAAAVFGADVRVAVAPRSRIVALLGAAYGEAGGDDIGGIAMPGAGEAGAGLDAEADIEASARDLLDETSDAPFIRLVNAIIARAIREGASDVHIEPFPDSLRVRFRLDGVLYDRCHLAAGLHAAMVSRMKILAKLDIAQRRLPQDGRISLALGGRKVDLRVATLPTGYGERVVLRVLEKSARVLCLDELGAPPEDIRRITGLAALSHGVVLITGPTGSGKTTTLYALLRHINTPARNILTIEDPVEYQLDGIGQMQVQENIGLTFAAGLRSIVRQDPDVILIGEIRDRETAEIAVQAALTGHLVFATLHTNDAASAVTRLVDMGIEPFLLSSVLGGIVAQRLVRRLCPSCAQAYEPQAEELRDLGLSHPFGGAGLYRAGGCEACRGTGYRGRKAVMEVLCVDESFRRLVAQTPDADVLRRHAVAGGMRPLARSACRDVVAGKTSVAEVLRVTRTA